MTHLGFFKSGSIRGSKLRCKKKVGSRFSFEENCQSNIAKLTSGFKWPNKNGIILSAANFVINFGPVSIKRVYKVSHRVPVVTS